MSRYQRMFGKLEEKNQGAFVPFVMLGDPDLQTSLEIITTLVENGADALELGFPYSDPIADGPTIQQASIRALAHRITPTDCLSLLKQARQRFPDMPIGLLLYSNLIMAAGVDNFYRQLHEAGVDSVLIADVPIRELAPFAAAARTHQIQQILIAPPNADDDTLKAIGEQSEGYTYLLGRAGVTGAETAAAMPTEALIKRLSRYNVAQPLLGFGISKPQQVSAAIHAGAAGAISGSATINIIAQNLDDKPKMLSELATFVSKMKQATAKQE